MDEPLISVGILHAPSVRFTLHSDYLSDGDVVTGEQEVVIHGGKLLWNGRESDCFVFDAKDEDASFTLSDVTIGIDFHWERKEMQTFKGALRVIMDDDAVCVVNVLPLEEYLKSVISSEMSSTASLEFLKSHAIISRSWALAQVRGVAGGGETSNGVDTSDLHVRWYDHDAHSKFNVCADDHCQRYQGITRIKGDNAVEAVRATRGMVLMYDGEICDARFSKCCGGVMEEFQNCWEDKPKAYLRAVPDSVGGGKAFCDTTDKRILSQVLNGYDQETVNFFRWRQEYGVKELSELIKRKSGVDFGDVVDLVPVKCGPSGRLVLLKIVGTKRMLTVGKELEIRKWLSDTHLYSSAFDVEKVVDDKGEVTRFVLNGRGWGHGVGLCQIGAAVMGDKGYGYDEILAHYYPGSKIERIY